MQSMLPASQACLKRLQLQRGLSLQQRLEERPHEAEHQWTGDKQHDDSIALQLDELCSESHVATEHAAQLANDRAQYLSATADQEIH